MGAKTLHEDLEFYCKNCELFTDIMKKIKKRKQEYTKSKKILREWVEATGFGIKEQEPTLDLGGLLWSKTAVREGGECKHETFSLHCNNCDALWQGPSDS